MKKENLLKVLSIMLFSMIFALQAKAQDITVTGTVNDNFGPVIGASVLVKGTTNGCITDLDGKFTLSNVSAKGTLVVSFVGYQTQEIPVKGQTTFTIDLKEDAQQLQEVVVVAVGYGDVKRRDLTGSIGKANMEDLTKTPVNNVAESLGGRVAGVQVSSGDGGLGDNFNIVIRGAGSLTQDTSPLYVIDGFPSESSGMAALNPNDIESIDILKDASATAIYGSRGANGVVIITTKKGKSGKVKVSYNGSVSVSKVKNLMEVMDAYDFVRLQQEVLANADPKEVNGQMIPLFDYYYLQDGKTIEDYKTIKNYDWQDEIYRTAISHNHHVALNGGSEKMDYAASLSYSDQQGVILNSELKRYQGRFQINQRINDKIKVNASANYASIIQGGPNPSINATQSSYSLLYSVWGYRPVSPSGNDLLESLYDEEAETNDYRFNPVKSVQNEFRQKTTNNFQFNFGVEWEIIKNLKFKTTGGYTSKDYKNEEFNNSQTRTGNSHPSNAQSKGVNAKLYQSENKSYLNENTLSYVFNKKNHNINALLGITFQKNTFFDHEVEVNHIVNEKLGMSGLGKGDTPKVSASKWENTLMSYLGRINYNYASKYYVTFSMRADGSSKFAPGHRWGYFPSGSLAWAFQREKFVEEKLPWLSNGKLRVSYGLTGNNRIGCYDYLAQLAASKDDDDKYKYFFGGLNGSGGTFTSGAFLSNIAVPNLKWETTEQYDFGLDLGFFDGRLNVNMDYYIKNTKDLLMWADTPASSGYANTRLNVGELQNKGFELTIESTNIKTKNFEWSSSFNIAFNKNEIKSLNYGQTQLESTIRWDKKFEEQIAYISRVGESAGKMYGFVYDGTYKEEDFNIIVDDKGKKKYELKPGIVKFKEDCRPGDPKYKNVDGSEDNLITNNDRTIIGNGHPLHTGGFTNNFRYKNWDASIFFQWSYGNDIYNINRIMMENVGDRRQLNQFASYNNRWSESNPTSDMPRACANGNFEYSSLYVEDGSFLKLKTISLGYTFDKKLIKKVGLSSARVFFSAENIATFTSYSGSDPEVSTRHSVMTPGFDWSAYPRAFNASLGVNVTF